MNWLGKLIAKLLTANGKITARAHFFKIKKKLGISGEKKGQSGTH